MTNEQPPAMPPAWADLIEALQLLARGQSNDISPTLCAHDELVVMADPQEFSAEELAHIEKLGFFPNEYGTFSSFRFGNA